MQWLVTPAVEELFLFIPGPFIALSFVLNFGDFALENAQDLIKDQPDITIGHFWIGRGARLRAPEVLSKPIRGKSRCAYNHCYTCDGEGRMNRLRLSARAGWHVILGVRHGVES
jgi:hypothetical protein